MAEDRTPTSQPAAGVPARVLDRVALDRVLRRAAELQLGAGEAPEHVTEAQLVELAREVGISESHVRQALAEERTRVVLSEETGWLGRVAGPARVGATRTVRGSVAGVLSSLDTWMQREECLQVRRRWMERITWEPRRDLLGNIRRGFNIGGRGYNLTRAAEVGATVTPVDDHRVLVMLDAELESARLARLRDGAITAVGGAAVAGTAIVLGVLLPVALIPAMLGAGGAYGVVRGHRRTATRVQLGLEQVLDRLEHGESGRSRSVLGMLTGLPHQR